MYWPLSVIVALGRALKPSELVRSIEVGKILENLALLSK
jgi:hypothetical protein